MKDVAPSIGEIVEVKNIFENSSFQEICDMNFFGDRRKVIMIENMTEILMRHANDNNKEKIWKLCKKLTSYTHCPVTLKEYLRMKSYAEDLDIVDVVLSSIQNNYYPFTDGTRIVESIEGYWYCIAIISQTDYRKDECKKLLKDLINFFETQRPDEGFLIKRNMEVLSREYHDLDELNMICQNKF